MRLLTPQGQMTAVEVHYLPQGLTCGIRVLLDRARPAL
jgi:hypothetical protein